MTAVDVYLVPVGSARYELYCEFAEVDDVDPASRSERGGFYARCRRIMVEAQQLRRARRLAAVPSDPTVRLSWTVRLRDSIIGRVAEAIVEWRLLWHLRKQSEVELVYPEDIEAERALTEARVGLQRDADHHRGRLIIAALTAAVLGPLLFFVPGPNLVAYYFLFLAVGHFLAFRGAKHGLDYVEWHTRPNAPLVNLRGIFALPSAVRAAHIRDVEKLMELEGLASFVERMVIRFR